MNSSDNAAALPPIHQSPFTDHFQRLCEVVAQLRAPGGCPWDREQTNETLLPALIEEAYEVVGAVRARDDLNLREELGDLMLLVVMHAEIAAEAGRFQINDALREVTEKLVRRHPHVFDAVAAGVSPARKNSADHCSAVAAGTAATTDSVVKQWETIKHEEKTNRGYRLADLPASLPALMRAQKTQKKAARVNFDWAEISDVMAKVEEELAETKEAMAARDPAALADEIGDLLFAVVNLARKNKLDAETVLQSATDKFVARFGLLEDELCARGKKLEDVALEELDQIWNAVKAGPKSARATP